MPDGAEDRILLAHGGGGVLMHELVADIVATLGECPGEALQDSAVLSVREGRIAFTTDTFVVNPLFFPGGDIGRLSVCGTVNDLAVCGARPLYVSLSLIIEEGFPIASLRRIVDSTAAAADEAGVTVVTGDTKVVERGKGDGVFINTSGIGIVPPGIELSSAAARPGDLVIVNGSIGEHGLAILSRREGIDFGSELRSDTAPLSTVIVPLLRETAGVRGMRDATRGGLAAVLNEIAADSHVCIRIEEEAVPITEAVRAGCELMGYEPFHIANEGKFVTVVERDHAEEVLTFLKGDPLGRDAAVIGEVLPEPGGCVVVKTPLGGERVLEVPYGDLLPRIC
jgi:hydrogenase expression/formation protein HypE